MLKINTIHQGDCLELMKDLPDKSVDLIITSPPYEDISGAGYNGAKKDILFFKLYSDFMDKVFTEMHRILKDTGQIFFNIKSKTHNSTLKTPHWVEFLDTFQNFKLKSYIIWKYAGSFDSSKKRFHLDYEVIYHLSKTDDIYLNSNCGIKDPLTSVWYVPHNIKNRVHPTQMPEALVERILKITGKKEYLLLDIFSGSGTTCLVGKREGMDYIGFEINPECCDIANKRLKEVQLPLDVNTKEDGIPPTNKLVGILPKGL